MNYIATVANLYWTTSWADIISHTLGGAMVGGIFVFMGRILGHRVVLSQILLFTLIIGVLWEVFEMYTGMTAFTDIGYWLDTEGDILFDVFGSYLTYKYLIKNNG